MIHANDARVIAETINEEKKKPKYIWKVLNDRIEYAVIGKRVRGFRSRYLLF